MFNISFKRNVHTPVLSSLENAKSYNEKEVVKRIRRLSKDGWGGQNAILLGKAPVLCMVPHNTGMPTCPFNWYTKENGDYTEIISNQGDFTEIGNLAQILDNATEVMMEAYNKRIPVSSFNNFGILLTDNIEPNYSGDGEFVFINGNFLKKDADIKKAIRYFSNEFLDRFIGWNFGDVVRDNKYLENKLLDFNKTLIDRGDKKETGPGFEVCSRGKIDQFYRFPTE